MAELTIVFRLRFAVALAVAPFEDAHSSINASSIKRLFTGARRSPSFLTSAAERDQAWALVSRYARGTLQTFCQGRVEFGMLGADIGYLRIRSFSGPRIASRRTAPRVGQ